MKQSSLQLLTWLYPCQSQASRVMPYSDLQYLLPELTEGGRRSLVKHLGAQQFVHHRVTSEGLPILSLTSFGAEALKSQFPVFYRKDHPWQREWSLLVFLEAPKHDLNFRYLRSKLLALRAGQLSRGSYLFPGSLPFELIEVLQKLYKGHATVAVVRSWSFGDERTILDALYKLSDSVSIYSGISNELSQLLDREESKKRLNEKQKVILYSIFKRFFDPFSKDIGILKEYFPHEKDAFETLLKFQTANIL